MVDTTFLAFPTSFANLNTEISLYFCDNCKSETPDIVEDYARGDLICRDCGYVVSDRIIDEGADFRNFADSLDDNSRVGYTADPLLRVADLTTTISYQPSTSSSSTTGSNLARQQSKINTSQSNKNLISGFSEIERIADHFAAAFYYASRQQGMTRTIAEIINVIRVSKKDISRCMKIMKSRLPSDEMTTKSLTTDDFVSRFCNNLGLSKDIVKYSTFITNKLAELQVMDGRNPLSCAAASIYFSTKLYGIKTTLKMVSDISGITSVTISNNYREMLKFKQSLLAPNCQNLKSKLEMLN
ncbi:transcription initiation factor IIB [Heterostelium album PN500]|uniref:General transcription factor TFIIB n=1 Tax=Heterostelium pallidum (strain ATCC 26659 / Pp 5 / PN500) TaxID=670386 RepID=D3B537_HETP5|nr:transcription initiation factor IIB [Heterostelium album PN500]EFA83402.1 transcription initiation factor IIB [Heterostelium album PN500]|eukprot:XP_020435519.1 transcription initiation factor IIB [Heterostelium album PN500]